MAGGELTYTWLFGTTYQFTATFYRDCSGVSAPSNLYLSIYSASCGVNSSVVMGRVSGTGQEITYPCSTTVTKCSSSSSSYQGYQKYQYQVTIDLSNYKSSAPAGQCTDWVFSFNDCCRNSAINTIVSPGSQSMYIPATLNNVASPTNSSPSFTNIPVVYLCQGQTFCYNAGGLDVDGDSVVYSLIAPKTSSSSNVSFVSPYSPSNPIASSPAVTMDPSTGQVCMTPSTQQIGLTAIYIQEYKNGQLIGSVIRDIQFVVISCSNAIPTGSGINGANDFTDTICPGSQLCFDITSSDINSGQILTMSWNNGISGATFTTSGSPYPTGHFCWTPTVSHARSQPYMFTVTVRDNACPINGVQTYAFSIYVLPFSATLTATNVSCTGGTNGSITATSSGVAPFTYYWNTGQTTSSITGLSAGNYIVTVSAGNGCTGTFNQTVTQPSTIAASVSSTNLICNNGAGSSGGRITIIANGGTSPYTYLWSSGQTATSISGLAAGTYSVTVTDSKGCKNIFTQSLTQPTVIVPTATQSIGSCSGGNTGVANVTATGGTGAYTYLWNNASNSTTVTATGLSAGTYTITVGDANGCKTTTQVVVSASPAYTAPTTVLTNATCNCIGTATVTTTGGTPNFTYAWSNGQTISNASGLCGGNYVVVVTDANMCTASGTVTITQPSTLAVISSNTDLLCYGNSDGTASVNITGGQAPYSYLWSNGETTTSLTGLVAGNYVLSVTDDLGCLTLKTVSITQPNLLAPVTSAIPSCAGPSNGQVSVTTTGGVSAYSYLWSNGSTTSLVTGLAGGAYTVTVTDANGCTSTSSSTVGAIPTITINSPSICRGQASASLTASGGISYTWSTGTTVNPLVVSPTTTTTYSVTGTNSYGCTSRVTTTVTVNTLPTLIGFVSSSYCAGSTGTSTQSSSNTPGPYTYVWSNGFTSSGFGTTSTATGLTAGTYTVTITNGNGCTAARSITALEKTTPVFSWNGVTVCSNAYIQMSLSYYNASGILYQWSPATGLNQTFGTPLATPTTTTTYTVVGSLGTLPTCRDTETVTITVNPAPIVALSASTNTYCGGSPVTFTATGNNHIYSWSPSSGLTYTNDSIVSATPTTTTTYSVTVTDANGCTSRATYTVSAYNYTASAAATTICSGTNVQLNAAGGTTYQWSPSTGLSDPNIASPTANPTTTTTYSVTITSGGCTQTLPVTVNVSPPASTPTLTQAGDTLFVTTDPSYTGYQWYFNGSPVAGATDTMMVMNQNGTYTVTVSNQNGCTATSAANSFSGLPIELIDFRAVPLSSFVALYWITSSEVNNDYFTVEKSADGDRFVEVFRMKGAGNSTGVRDYTGIDRNPLHGVSYYRLKQTDFDGKYSYSKLVAVDFGHVSDDPVRIYPNPVTSQLSLHINPMHVGQTTTVSIMSTLGAVVLEESVTATDRIIISIKDLPAAMYYVRVLQPAIGANWVGKFVKK